ncbi:MAG: glycosyltransferase [Chlorobiaceae bacterium]|jgi:glycosyltransferase involved in cell wall biosynthesis
MNILFSNSIGRDKFGGGEKWMVNAAKELAKRGHNVVLGSKKNSKILDYATSNGVKTTVFEIRGDISPLSTLKVAAFLKQQAIDVLICNLNKDVRVAGLAAQIVQTPVVLARHGMLLCGNKWKHKVTLTKLVDGIITNSNTIKESYRNYGWFDDDFVKVIYNGIIIPETIVAYNFSVRFPGKKIIYSAGRLSEQKGFTWLIEAAAILKKTRNDLIFAISGEGKLEADLKKQVANASLEDSFIFMGFTDNIYPYLKGCDLFVLASLFEGMPNVVMEAMAMQKPVIATDVNGARELMVDGKTGIIVPPKQPEALAAAIEKIIDNPEILAEFGKSGYERVTHEFTMNAMGNKLEEYLQQKMLEKQHIL